MKKKRSFSNQLRAAIEDSGITRYRIAKDTGIDQSVLHRFVTGQTGLSVPTIDALVEYLGLELRPIVQAAKKKGR